MKHYNIRTFFSAEDEGYISTLAEFPSLSAFGETATESIQELEQAFEAVKESAKEGKCKLPEPYTTESLNNASKLLNLSEIARQSELSVQTLASKVKRGTELADDEKQAIIHTLQRAGIHLLTQ